MKPCASCGTQVPDDVQECPHCHQAIAGQTEAIAPKPKSHKLIYGLIIFAVLVLIFILAVAWPAIRKMQAKSMASEKVSNLGAIFMQSEAYSNLGVIFTSEISYFGEKNSYANTFDLIKWRPEGTTYYAYFLPGQVIQPTVGGPYQLPEGDYPRPAVSNTGFTVIAVGNIDNNPTLDVWIVNDRKAQKIVINDLEK